MLKSTIIYFAGRVGVALIVVLSISIYTRLLSPAEYGVYALIVSGVTMAYAAVVQWMAFSLGRFLPAYPEREDLVLSHVAASYLVVAVLVVVVASLAVPFLEIGGNRSVLLVLGVIFFLAISFSELSLAVFQARRQPRSYIGFALLRVAVAGAIGIALAFLGWGGVGLLVGLVAGNLCISLPNALRNWRVVRFRLLERRLLRELAAYGLPFALTGACGAFITLSDRYILEFLIGAEATGLYAAAYDLAMRTLHVLMMVVAMACNPVIFRAYEVGGPVAAEPLIRSQGELLLGLSLPAAIGFIMLAPAITAVMLGKEFQQAARELIPWIAVATVLSGFQAFYLSLAFALPRQPLQQTAVFAAGALLNVVLNFVLIPRLGLIGAALATVAAYALIMAGSLLVGRRLYVLPFSVTGLWKILAGCATLALILWPVRHSIEVPMVILHGAAGAIAYAAIVCGLDLAQSRRPFGRVLQRGLALMRAGPARS
jgi:O-antigen/teichoic acid export membrane protein